MTEIISKNILYVINSEMEELTMENILTSLSINVIGGIIVFLLFGGGITYYFINKSKKVNTGIIQKDGTTQLAFQKSKNNHVHLGGGKNDGSQQGD